MKTAEVWFTELNHYDLNLYRDKLRTSIKQIQLEAAKRGMEIAADVCVNNTMQTNRAYMKSAILTARDNLKDGDL